MDEEMQKDGSSSCEGVYSNIDEVWAAPRANRVALLYDRKKEISSSSFRAGTRVVPTLP